MKKWVRVLLFVGALLSLGPLSASGQTPPFTQALRIRTDREPLDTWLIQLNLRTVTPIEKDDVLLATYWARGVAASAETGSADRADLRARV